MFNVPELGSFLLYMIVVMSVGYYFFFSQLTLDEYILGGKQLGVLPTAISAQASDMSGWLLMGLPGAIYLGGLDEAWIAIGLAAGTILNWWLVAPRLRAYTGRTGSLTLPHFFEKRFGDPTGLLRVLSALITLFFFTVYAAAGLNATGVLFETMFAVPFRWALWVGGISILVYTFLGGYLAVCWTDVVQGGLIILAIVVVPVVAWDGAGGASGIVAAAERSGLGLSLWPDKERPLLYIISAASWGLGYCGMPHILARFMSVGRVSMLRAAGCIASVWVIICLGCSVLVGLIGLSDFPGLASPAQETIFIRLCRAYFPPLLSGLFLASILAAIMSTIDSQLLTSASVLTEDLNRKLIRRKLSGKERLFYGRIGVAIISLIALFIASRRDSTVLELVEYAWGGLGAAFGPVVIMALYSRRCGWRSALLGMCLGFAATVVWELSGMNEYLYELVPGFAVNLAAMVVGNRIWPQADPEILAGFDAHAIDVLVST